MQIRLWLVDHQNGALRLFVRHRIRVRKRESQHLGLAGSELIEVPDLSLQSGVDTE